MALPAQRVSQPNPPVDMSAHQELEALLAIPPQARTVRLPVDLTAQITAKFINFPANDHDAQQQALTVRELQNIRHNLSDLPVCFYPFGGADAFYPVLLSNAKVSILTGREQWGGIDDIHRALDLNRTASAIHGLGLGSGYDDVRDWGQASEEFGFKSETLGPLSVIRAAVAQVLNGEDVRKLDICAFDVGMDGHLHFSKMNRKVSNDNVAFWLTNADGHRKLYLYTRLSMQHPAAADTIHGLHALLSRTSGARQVLQLQKGIPPELFEYEDSRRLLTPPGGLIKAIVCDAQRNRRDAAQPIFLHDSGLTQESVSLGRVPGRPSWEGPAFGYGNKVFLHRSV
jgi:hypothetical protein